MTEHHPLRPDEGFILVCEGETDKLLLDGIFERHAQDISVYDARGRDNVLQLSAILEPAVYVIDRDFGYDSAQAQLTFSSKKPKTVWRTVDIESYLLWPDWIMAAIAELKNKPRAKMTEVPTSEVKVEQQIKKLAQELVPDHAGHRLLDELNVRIDGFYLDLNAGGKLKKGTAINTVTDWEAHLTMEMNRFEEAKNRLIADPQLSQSTAINQYRDWLERYSTWSSDITTIRLEFSGKRLLPQIAAAWHLRSTSDSEAAKHTAPWELLRDELIKRCLGHSRAITLGELSRDMRLTDFGQLASKITGRTV